MNTNNSVGCPGGGVQVKEGTEEISEGDRTWGEEGTKYSVQMMCCGIVHLRFV